MFGIYLHAIVHHAPYLYEILNLKATNAEHEQRLFGQAKIMVNSVTNGQPDTIIPNLFLRLQAKQKVGGLYHSYLQLMGRVSKALMELNVDILFRCDCQLLILPVRSP